jgi:predicted amino acid dehydrogenase
MIIKLIKNLSNLNMSRGNLIACLYEVRLLERTKGHLSAKKSLGEKALQLYRVNKIDDPAERHTCVFSNPQKAFAGPEDRGFDVEAGE